METKQPRKPIVIELVALAVVCFLFLLAAYQPRIGTTELMKAEEGRGTNTFTAGVSTNESGATKGIEFFGNSRIYHDESDDALVLSNLFQSTSVRLVDGIISSGASNHFVGDVFIGGDLYGVVINFTETNITVTTITTNLTVVQTFTIETNTVVNNYATNNFYNTVNMNGNIRVSTNLFVNFGFFTNLLGFLDANGTFTGWRHGTPSLSRTQTVATVQFASADDVQLDWTLGDVYEGTNGAGHDMSLNLTNLVRGATLSVDILGSQTERSISVTAPSGVTILWGTDTNGSFAFTARTNGITSASFTVINSSNVIASAKPFGPW